MATIASVNTKALTEVAISPTTLGASDTFVYTPGVTKFLVINNASGGAITPNIDGDGQDSVYVRGVGDVDISGGYEFGSIANGDSVIIDLDAISAYLQGTIAVTGGDSAEAYIITV
jgi:hypothetical protein